MDANEREKLLVDELCEWFKVNKLPMSLRVEFDLDSYLKAGIISLEDLEEGYYLGSCRNNHIAYWNPTINRFEHTRSKYGKRYVEEIPHLGELDYKYDLFIPIRKMDIEEVDEFNNVEKWK